MRGFSLCQSGTDCSAHPISCGISGLFPLLQSYRGVKLTTDFCLLLLLILAISRNGARLPYAFVAWTEGQLYGIQFQLFLCFALYFLVFWQYFLCSRHVPYEANIKPSPPECTETQEQFPASEEVCSEGAKAWECCRNKA